MAKRGRLSIKVFVALCTIPTIIPSWAMAEAIGMMDARTLSMGGVSVAIGSSHEGPWYNPALLSMHQGDEDETWDGRMGLPNMMAIASDSVREAYRLSQDDTAQELSIEINNFNARVNNSIDDAQNITDLSDRLLDAAETFRDTPVLGDFSLGWVLAEPGDWQGGGFFIRSRIFAEGVADITDVDLERLNSLVEGFRFLSSGGVEGSPQPDLLDENGNIIDITSDLTSEARASATTLFEAGVSFSKVWTLFGQPVALGMTPKWTSWRVDQIRIRLSDNDLERATNNEPNVERINLDLGAVTHWGNGWRAGLSAMNVIPHDIRFGDLALKQEATWTLGVGQILKQWRWGVDAQLSPSGIPGSQFESQWVSLGGEWRPFRSLQFRVGLREDLNGDFDRRWSLGTGFYAGRINIDFARMWSENGDGLALQIGYAL